jgi:hypothetical protein
MKLHLGCGQYHLEGYVNIDFPLSSHTAQRKSVADEHADITSLRYPPESVEEVRLHHVFEHFTRPVACALLASWHSWLVPGGTLHIEVPDFGRTAINMLNPLASMKSRLVAERHIFGSHEAHWAHHFEGYTHRTLSHMLGLFGFKVIWTNNSSWKGTYNIEIKARKDVVIADDVFESVAREFLHLHLLDNSEERLLEQWMLGYSEQIKTSFAIKGGYEHN